MRYFTVHSWNARRHDVIRPKVEKGYCEQEVFASTHEAAIDIFAACHEVARRTVVAQES